jgi:hypothetical protein
VSITGNGDVLGEFWGAGVWLFSDSGGWTHIRPADATSIGLAANG